MASYSINKGVNKPAEFKGLQSQYLLIFAGGLLGSFVLFIILYLAGVNQWVCIFLGVILALLVIYTTLSLRSCKQITTRFLLVLLLFIFFEKFF